MGLLVDFDVAGLADEDLPGAVVARGDTRDVGAELLLRGGIVRQNHGGEVGIGTGADDDIGAIAVERLVHGVAHLRAGGEGRLAVGAGEGDPFEGDELATVVVHVVLDRVEVDSLDDRGVGRADDLIVLLPDILLHTSDAVAVVGIAYLGHLAVAADVESFEVDEDLLSLGEVAEETAFVDGDDDRRGVVLEDDLLVDVATEVIARDTAFDLDIFRDLLVLVGGGEDVGVLLDEVGDGDDVALCQAVVAEGSLRVVRLIPVAVHAGCEETAQQGKEDQRRGLDDICLDDILLHDILLSL